MIEGIPQVESRLNLLRKAGLAVARELGGHTPSGVSPLMGFCADMAVVVQVVMGGDIVQGKVQGCRHFWNRLPGGREVDLTSCQFGGDGFAPLGKGRKVQCDKLTPLRFLAFANMMVHELKNG